MSKPKPSRPFQEIAMDFCSFGGQQFLIVVDCFTDWPEVIPMQHDTSTSHLIQALTQLFYRTAVPDVLWSNDGPQFTSKLLNEFSKQWGFLHKTSSPHYPQSNGKIEATVKSIKRIIKTSWGSRSLQADTMARALLQYRNTPSQKDGQSPAQKLFGRPMQDTLPAHRRSFAPEWQRSTIEAEQLAANTLAHSESYYNAHAQQLASRFECKGCAHVHRHMHIHNSDFNLVVGLILAQSPNLSYCLNYFKGALWKYLQQSANLPQSVFSIKSSNLNIC